mmetsp:Transcript_18992/g.27216  ORF Transcript_18992/g.27216 Transcript_18992/m.27216 type:complete len:100 (-) Transcript_18992:144-443(-)
MSISTTEMTATPSVGSHSVHHRRRRFCAGDDTDTGCCSQRQQSQQSSRRTSNAIYLCSLTLMEVIADTVHRGCIVRFGEIFFPPTPEYSRKLTSIVVIL